jgi:phytoene dehydrogenase-like protein
MDCDYEIIIIGAGLSGLAAGIRLAHYGRRVAIVERHTLPGGLNSYYRRQGREFDVGLHAMTNFVPPENRAAPLNRLLRQLRLAYADLDLRPQQGSAVCFPQGQLRFSNRFDDLEAGVSRTFPGQLAGFRGLVARVLEAPAYALDEQPFSARAEIGRFLTDPLLADLLLCPLLFYGSPMQDDMTFAQFCIMFRSVYLEGLARPAAGIRALLDRLLARYRESGGTLVLGCGVRRLRLDGGRIESVELVDGRRLRPRAVLSSAGYLETLRLCEPQPDPGDHPAGQISFVETILVLNRSAASLGFTDSILFFNDAERFRFARPAAPVDAASGVLCAPGNFAGLGSGVEHSVRLTQLANHEAWHNLPDDVYQAAKSRLLEQQMRTAERFLPGIGRALVATDLFTPRTVQRFTGHIHGAVYGSPRKVPDGRTPVEGLFLCGTDQGFLGIVGALLSGITMANRHFLRQAGP